MLSTLVGSPHPNCRTALTATFLVVDLKVYPVSLFNVTLAIGIYLVRFRRKRLGLPRPTFRAWDVAIIFNIAVNLYLVIMPWYPPPKGRNGGDVTFWYATYIVVGISV